jgi:hypothetical protein
VPFTNDVYFLKMFIFQRCLFFKDVKEVWRRNMKDENWSSERRATSLKDVRCLSETRCVGRQRRLVFTSLVSLCLSRDAKDAKDGLDVFLMFLINPFIIILGIF